MYSDICFPNYIMYPDICFTNFVMYSDICFTNSIMYYAPDLVLAGIGERMLQHEDLIRLPIMLTHHFNIRFRPWTQTFLSELERCVIDLGQPKPTVAKTVKTK